MKTKCNLVLLKRAVFHLVEISSQDKIDEHHDHITVGGTESIRYVFFN